MTFGLCLGRTRAAAIAIVAILAIVATTRRASSSSSSSSSSAVLAASLAQNRNHGNRNHKESHTRNLRAAYLSKLLSHATRTRTRLPEEEEEEEEGHEPNEEATTQRFLDQFEFVVGGGFLDLSEWSLEFDQCRSVQAYNFDADSHGDSSILAIQQFAIFRMCPSDVCRDTATATATTTATARSSSSSGSLSSSCLQSGNFGDYAIDLQEYLRATVAYHRELQDQRCDACWEEECVPDDDDDVDCDAPCHQECAMIENMEANGYMDATRFLECQMIYDPMDDDRPSLYAGPLCRSNANRIKTGIFRHEEWKTNGSKIQMGVFSDPDCTILEPGKNVEDYLVNEDGWAMRLSYHLWKKATSPQQCIPCGNGQQQHGRSLELCNELYYASAKCETPHGFQAGMATSNHHGSSVYLNQLAQEDMVCDFVASLRVGEYFEGGEIWIVGGSNTPQPERVSTGQWIAPLPEPRVTAGQWIAIGILILACLGLAGVACRLAVQLSKLLPGSGDVAGARRTSASSLKVAIQEQSPNETAKEEDGSNTMEAASLLAKDERAEEEDDGGDHDGDCGDP